MQIINGEDPMVRLVNERLVELERARAPQLGQAAARQDASTGGIRYHVLDLTTATSPLPRYGFDISGYSVTICKGGSDHMAVLMDLGEAGIYGPVFPGMTIRPQRKFTRIRIAKWTSTTVPIAGGLTDAGAFTLGRYLTIAVGLDPLAEVIDAQGGPAGFVQYRVSSTQVYNVATNVPTLDTDGINARGATSIKVGVFSASNISGGTIRWWFLPHTGGAFAWGLTDLQQTIPTGTTVGWCAEFEAAHSGGRYFPELNLYTNAGGSGSPQLVILSHGLGGELNAGDVSP